MLLVSSYYFYMQWNWKYIFLIVGLTLVNFYAAKYIADNDDEYKKKIGLFTALTISLGVLFFFKYFNFFNEALQDSLGLLSIDYKYDLINIILPVGISFYTFQTLSYTIDVYRKKYAHENSLTRFALYVSYFPQLVAGPIERAGHLLDQFKVRKRFDIRRISDGSKLLLWGLFKKVVIAEQLAIYVDKVYGHPELHSGPTLIMATYFFAFQIYLDFSAYSDMAIGMSKILGYDLMRNFRLPYLATSITDFWRRWHISLTTWFTDYIYIPMGGSRVALPRWIFNIFVVFLISGLWHGAAWTFVIWGLLHAFYYLVQIIWTKIHERYKISYKISHWISTPFKIFLTFNAVAFGWIFFRASSLSDAWTIVQKIFTEYDGVLYWGSSQVQTYLAIFFLMVFYIIQILQHYGYVTLYFSKSKFSLPIRWLSYLAMIFGLTLFGISDTAFIYFQF
ncbi:MBOAT family O-acyltransferase [Sulfurovum riftiae]|nr:MBOAT family O-acyltransferase [Sulfurovum riftiae]